MAEAPSYQMIQPRGEADLPKIGASVAIRGELYTRIHEGAYWSGRNEYPIPVRRHGGRYTKIDKDQSRAVARDRERRFDRGDTAAPAPPSHTEGQTPSPYVVSQESAATTSAGAPPPYTVEQAPPPYASGPGPTANNALNSTAPNTVGSRTALRDFFEAGVRFVQTVIENLISRFESKRRNGRSLVDQHPAAPQWPLAQSTASRQGQGSPPHLTRGEGQLPQQYNSTRAPRPWAPSNSQTVSSAAVQNERGERQGPMSPEQRVIKWRQDNFGGLRRNKLPRKEVSSGSGVSLPQNPVTGRSLAGAALSESAPSPSQTVSSAAVQNKRGESPATLPVKRLMGDHPRRNKLPQNPAVNAAKYGPPSPRDGTQQQSGIPASSPSAPFRRSPTPQTAQGRAMR